jgi:UDP-3-O-[3-hydroxymyristoyl] glucosamine N-acyltransferase
MGAIIGHDVTVGNYTTINPGCNIGGTVTIGDHCDFGLGCSVMQGVTIPSHVHIAGNSFVTKNCESWYLYLGIPAKRTLPLKRKAINITQRCSQR